MQRSPVESSCFRAAGYDAARREMEVEFHDGRVYRYAGVAPEAYAELMAAPSKGRYFARWVRDRYAYERLT